MPWASLCLDSSPKTSHTDAEVAWIAHMPRPKTDENPLPAQITNNAASYLQEIMARKARELEFTPLQSWSQWPELVQIADLAAYIHFNDAEADKL